MSAYESIIKSHRPDLAPYETIYKDLHQHPGLSLQESLAADTATHHLKSHGYEVRTNIGGLGLIGILKNGPGATVLLRADMDALPVAEQTGLSYASKVMQLDSDGVEKPVMHACGHDMHVTCLLGAAATLHNCRESWTGTLVVLFQPNEERGKGAQDMVDDGLYDPKRHACPIPDVLLGQHVGPLRAGSVYTKQGLLATAMDSFKITVYGKGGHAAMPQWAVDPVLLASSIVLRLQGIVSREVASDDQAVVTVASVQAGEAENVIPAYAVLRVNIRTAKPQTRVTVLAAVRRIVKAECDASGSRQDALFEVTSGLPATVNDNSITETLEESFQEYYGTSHTKNFSSMCGSEDFSNLATPIGKPYCYWIWGGADPERYDRAVNEGRIAEDIPANHSAFYAPVIQPTLSVGVDNLVIGALTFLKNGS